MRRLNHGDGVASSSVVSSRGGSHKSSSMGSSFRRLFRSNSTPTKGSNNSKKKNKKNRHNNNKKRYSAGDDYNSNKFDALLGTNNGKTTGQQQRGGGVTSSNIGYGAKQQQQHAQYGHNSHNNNSTVNQMEYVKGQNGYYYPQQQQQQQQQQMQHYHQHHHQQSHTFSHTPERDDTSLSTSSQHQRNQYNLYMKSTSCSTSISTSISHSNRYLPSYMVDKSSSFGGGNHHNNDDTTTGSVFDAMFGSFFGKKEKEMTQQEYQRHLLSQELNNNSINASNNNAFTNDAATTTTTSTTASTVSDFFGSLFGLNDNQSHEENLRSLIKKQSPSTRALLEAMESDDPAIIHWLAKTTIFRNLCDWSFEITDVDGSGDIDEQELYTGLLLIHLTLGSYIGSAGCKTLSREECHKVFQKFDQDNNGTLDKDEFRKVMMVLFNNVLLRIAVQFGLTLLIVPVITSFVLDGLYWLLYIYWCCIKLVGNEIISSSIILINIQAFAIQFSTYFHGSGSGAIIAALRNQLVQLIYIVLPEYFWKSIPLSFVSVLLGLMIVPLILRRVDEFIQKREIREKEQKLIAARKSIRIR